jgi:hypothetical protein
VLQLEPSRLSAAHRRCLSADARIEIDADGVAYLSIDGRRLIFAGTLERLLATLGLDRGALRALSEA